MARNTRQSLARWMPATLALVVILALAACSSDSMSSAYLQANNAALHQGASATAQPTQFVVEPGASARTVAAQLQADGLIKDAKLFEAYVRASGLAGKLQAGAYTLSPHMTPVQIAEALLHSRPASIALTVPEGWRLEQIADGLSASGIMDGTSWPAAQDLIQQTRPHLVLVEDQYHMPGRAWCSLKRLVILRALWDWTAAREGIPTTDVNPRTWQAWAKVKQGDKVAIQRIATGLMRRFTQQNESDAVVMVSWWMACCRAAGQTR